MEKYAKEKNLRVIDYTFLYFKIVLRRDNVMQIRMGEVSLPVSF